MLRPALSFIGIVGLLALPLVLVLMIGYGPTTITQNNDFFTLSIDETPEINVSTWNLTVGGLVNHPLTFTYTNFTAQPNATVVARLQCVEGPSGTAAWTGIPLNAILTMAEVKRGAIDVVFYGADGYTSSLAWPNQNSSDVLLAFAMNGEPLPPAQGFPLRVVAPSELGYKWVKWVYRIDVVDYDYKGYWESRGWSDNARLTTPSDWRVHATLLSASFLLGGLAAVSGVRQSKTSTVFQDLPKFVSRRFHIAVSVLFLVSAVTTFIFWLVATLLTRGSILYTSHGILGLISISLLVIGTIVILPNMKRPSANASWHGAICVLGFILFTLTIIIGFALTTGKVALA